MENAHGWGYTVYETEVVLPINDDHLRECRGRDARKHVCQDSWFLENNSRCQDLERPKRLVP